MQADVSVSPRRRDRSQSRHKVLDRGSGISRSRGQPRKPARKVNRPGFLGGSRVWKDGSYVRVVSGADSDAGSQFTSIRWGERLVELGAVPSIGSVGDSFDDALAESQFSLIKHEDSHEGGASPAKGTHGRPDA